MKKILIITNNINQNSGWGRYSASVINELIKLKFDVSVLTEKNQEKIQNELNILKPLNHSNIFNLIRNTLRVRKIAKKFDVIHAFDGWPYGIYGYFAVLGTKKNFFINGVGTYSVAPLFDKFKGFLLKRAYKKANKIFCISNYVKQRIMEKVSLNNLKVVHLGTTELPDLSQDEISFYREKFNIKDLHRPILLTVGGIKERKGQLDTSKASFYLKEKYPDYLYLIVGSDKDTVYIDKIKNFVKNNKLENNIKIISNAKTDKELSFFYNICDIFLLNSNNEDHHFEGF
ncbi:glycosyltransferase family 4 protein, partial [Patescibacteria group bacterium]|nr:glycosyltransferase family 4 protein [Patescibacteria group bacterium]